MMKRAKSSFRLVADHSVLSHLHLAKKLVPFMTFTSARPDNPSTFNAQFFGGISLGTNVFFVATLMMSIIQEVLKGKCQYFFDNEVIVYFLFSYDWCRRPNMSR
jgi:hypothetical protein